jgi:hypothetical protein
MSVQHGVIYTLHRAVGQNWGAGDRTVGVFGTEVQKGKVAANVVEGGGRNKSNGRRETRENFATFLFKAASQSTAKKE